MSASKGSRFRGVHSLIAAVGLMAALGASPASATLSFTGGTVGFIPAGSATNDLLDGSLFPVGPMAGTFGVRVSQSGNSNLKFDFLGFEAGFSNIYANTLASLDIAGQTFTTETFSPDDNHHATSLNSPLASFTTAGVNALLDFVFHTSGNGSVTNAGNIDNSAGTSTLPNFFVSKLLDGSLVV